MAVATTERFTDQNGGTWKVVTVAHQGGVRLFVTNPAFAEYELTPVTKPLPGNRPSVDSETPLPLDDL